MEVGEIIYYRRYVDDVIIIFDQNKVNEESVTNNVINKQKIFRIQTNRRGKQINKLFRSIHI